MNFHALAVALSVLVIIIASRRISHKIPGALIAVVGAITLSWAFDFGKQMHVLGVVPSGLPHIGLPGLVIYRFTHSMYYANAQQLSEEIADLVNDSQPPLRWFCLDASAVDDIDYSAAKTLRSIHAMLEEKNIRLVIAQLPEDVKEENHRALRKVFGKHAYYDTLEEVLTVYRKQIDKES